jgi:nitroreductase
MGSSKSKEIVRVTRAARQRRWDRPVKFKKSVTEVIRTRSSWRSYDGKPLDEQTKGDLTDFLSYRDDGPFGVPMSVHLVEMSESASWRTRAFGTYGFISGARQFLAGAVEKADKDLETYGYVFEKAILFATDLGLGTCWLGGTYNRSSFARKVDLRDNETLPAVSPVGYKKAKRGITDALVHRFAGSANRKPWKDIFFHNDLDTPINEAIAGQYSVPLEMVRLAPSAVNGQPWRIVKAEGVAVFHFLLQRRKRYDMLPTMDLQRIDMGIAMSHFELAAQEMNLKGKWTILNPDIGPLPKGTEYVVSWVEQLAAAT